MGFLLYLCWIIHPHTRCHWGNFWIVKVDDLIKIWQYWSPLIKRLYDHLITLVLVDSIWPLNTYMHTGYVLSYLKAVSTSYWQTIGTSEVYSSYVLFCCTEKQLIIINSYSFCRHHYMLLSHAVFAFKPISLKKYSYLYACICIWCYNEHACVGWT